MAVKTITITEEAYNKLAGNKKEGESFSELISRSFAAKGNWGTVNKFVGAWKDVPESAISSIKKEIENADKNSWKRITRKVKGI